MEMKNERMKVHVRVYEVCGVDVWWFFLGCGMWAVPCETMDG